MVESGVILHAGACAPRRLLYGGDMRIVLVTFGSEGHARPILSLAVGLMEAGHDVTVVGDGTASGLALDAGVDFASLGGGDATNRASRVLAWHNRIGEVAGDADAIVGSSDPAWVAVSVADSIHVPSLIASLHPVAPSRELPHPLSPRFDLPGPLVRHTGRLAAGNVWRAARDPLMAARARLGLPTFPRPWEDVTFLLGYSPTLVPRPSDWDDLQVVTGEWTMPRGDRGLPAGLAEFLDAGEPPVYVGFGASQLLERPKVRAALTQALEGRRILAVGPGSAELRAESPEGVFAVPHVEHDLVFPRCAVAIHHAAPGTTHSAVRWTVPSVTVPLEGDQPFWAWRIEELGVGAAPLSRNRLTPATVAEAVEAASNPNVEHRLDRLADSMRRERGVAEAVAVIERVAEAG